MATGTYDERLLRSLDRVRFTLGDVNDADFLFSDATINAILASEGGEAGATLALARGLIARFAQEPVRASADGTSVDYSERLTVWRGIVAAAATTVQDATGVTYAGQTARAATRATW